MTGYTYVFSPDSESPTNYTSVSSSCAETECLFVRNLQGDVEKVIGLDGSILASYTYDAWGQVHSASGSMAATNPIRYRGYYYDTETSLYYLQSRYYDPQTGRFLNADAYVTTGQGILSCNMFSYCRNNTVNRQDFAGDYDREAAAEYGIRWGSRRNRYFHYYFKGDCANFVSQCLLAGDLSPTKTWRPTTYGFYLGFIRHRISEGTYTWTHAALLYKYLSDPENGYIHGNVLKYDPRSEENIYGVSPADFFSKYDDIQVGDIVFLKRHVCDDPYHAMIITEIKGTDIYISGHTEARSNKLLWDLELGSDEIWVIRIRDDAK